MVAHPDTPAPSMPRPAALLELLKPLTWFPPVWAYLCGVVSVGVSPLQAWPMVVLGMVLAGPVVCGMSQAANDWCDRHVDAINEPGRPIPSGRVPGRWGLYVALIMSVLALGIGWLLGPWGFGATVAALGFFSGMFAVAAIGAMMAMAGEGRSAREGTRIGLWGASQAMAAGFGGLVGAAAVDVMRTLAPDAAAFGAVFAFEAALFLLAAHMAARVVDGSAVRAERPSLAMGE